eukprot:scaffold44612_cov58-Phaeocystis_antarctica.AAC.5
MSRAPRCSGGTDRPTASPCVECYYLRPGCGRRPGSASTAPMRTSRGGRKISWSVHARKGALSPAVTSLVARLHRHVGCSSCRL